MNDTPRIVPASISSRDRRGFTLIEIMMSAVIFALLMGGTLTALIQSRRLTEGSISQNSAVTILQGYIEQMKNMEFDQIPASPALGTTSTITIPTLLDKNTPDPLTLSRGAAPTTIPAVGSTAPTNVVNNTRTIDINDTPSTTLDDLNLNLWVWVQDLTGTATNVTRSKSITIVYTWQFYDGGKVRTFRDSVRTIRSVVPTF